jgi:hypothetical protein
MQEDLRQLKGGIFRIFTKEMEVQLLWSTTSIDTTLFICL